ncbi:MAG: hypothetical protein O2960_12925 [Verrucomicrobia bacterium]|nr:hypothetical protein [Verrucomicrobiota bacterium]
MIIRKLAKILRGDSTPFQLFAACLLGSTLGFLPGFAQAPGLILTFAALLILLNANLALAGIVGVLAKLVSLALTPVAFGLGRFLLDGPTQAFRSIINAPLLAWFGFDYYTTTGGVVLGLIFGLGAGALIVKGVTAFRKRMKKIGDSSEAFNRIAGKGWVKILSVVLVGGASKKSFDDLLSRRVGNPIRVLGLVFLVLVAVLGFIFQQFASGPIVRMALESGLGRANGATVDVGEADLDMKSNRLTIINLAVANAKALDTDLFRARKLEADLSGVSLLRKRVAIDRLSIAEASQGEKRAEPGQAFGKKSEPIERKPITILDAKSIDEYLKSAQVWRERLAQLQDWLEKISGPASDTAGKSESLKERLEREVAELGYTRVRASHLIEGAPTLTITELVIQGLKTSGIQGETLNVKGANLSTHPQLLGKAAQIRIESSGNSFLFETALGGAATAGTENRLELAYRNLETDKLASGLRFDGTNPVQGGTTDLSINGTWLVENGVTVNLEAALTLRDSTIQLPKLGPSVVKELTIPIHIEGELKNPAIRIDGKQLQDALARAGVSQAKEKITEKAREEINKKLDGKIGESLGGQGKKLLNGILGGKKDTP